MDLTNAKKMRMIHKRMGEHNEGIQGTHLSRVEIVRRLLINRMNKVDIDEVETSQCSTMGGWVDFGGPLLFLSVEGPQTHMWCLP